MFACPDQIGNIGGAGEEVLHIVEDQQHLIRVDPAHNCFKSLLLRGRLEAEGARDGGQDHHRIADAVQRYKPDAIAKARRKLLGGCLRQAGLANARRPGQRHYPGLVLQ